MAAPASAEDAGSMAVIVKNTFLDLDDGPRMPVLARYKSAPNPDVRDHDDDDDEDEDESVQAPPDDEGEGEPPPQPDLYRNVTLDGYEPMEAWSWLQSGSEPTQMPAEVQTQMPAMPTYTGDMPAASSSGSGGYTAGMIPVPMGSQAVSMVVVPATSLMGAVPVAGLESMVVPVDRFARWPTGMAPPPSEAAPDVGPSDSEPRSPAPDKEALDLPPVPAVARPAKDKAPVLQRIFSVGSAVYRVRWTVDARSLKSTDREKVSPKFEISGAGKPIEFTVVLKATSVSGGRGGSSFKKAKGKGTMELKCVSDIEAACTLRFRMGVGTGGSENHRMSSLVRHDFSTKPICGLTEEEDFDFNKVVDEESQTFVVSVEVLASAQS